VRFGFAIVIFQGADGAGSSSTTKSRIAEWLFVTVNEIMADSPGLKVRPSNDKLILISDTLALTGMDEISNMARIATAPPAPRLARIKITTAVYALIPASKRLCQN